MQVNNEETLIDVRTAGEFDSGHIIGAVNIPLNELQQHIAQIKTLPMPVIIYCRSGARSGMAVAILKLNGISEAVDGGAFDTLKRNYENTIA